VSEGLAAGELILVLIAGVVSLTVTLVPLVIALLLSKRVQRLEARLTALERQRGGAAGVSNVEPHPK
jgi:hypothetical protein